MAGPHDAVPPHAASLLETWGPPAGEAPVAVLAVHGRGQDPAYLRELFARLDVDAHVVAPVADEQSWYPGSFLKPPAENQPHLDGAVGALERALETLDAEGYPADRVVVLGFSQGACLLSHLLLTAPRRFAGAVLLTGGYQGPDEDPAPEPAPALAGMPVVMSLGTRDPWVPFDRAERTRDVLVASGAEVRFLPFDGDEHVVSDEAVAAARSLIRTAARTGGLPR